MLTDARLAMRLADAEPQQAAPDPQPARRTRGHLRLSIHPPGDCRRAAVETFIAGIYRECYGARIRAFAPNLVVLQSADEIVAAAGYRDASSRLFLEGYLDVPVEQCLAAATGVIPSRATIVEVGHLASIRNGAGRLLMPFLGAHLAAEGYDWVVSTATEELHHLFRRLGLTPLVLGDADPCKLGGQAADWGSYYDHHPKVLAGSIAQGMAQLTGGRQ